MDRLPEKHTDYMQAVFVLGERPLGIFQKASSYDIRLELFWYGREGARLKYRFPQTDKKGDVTYRVVKCDDLPPFDLCLELNKNPWGGPKRYHGMRDDSGHERVATLRRSLEGQASNAP